MADDNQKISARTPTSQLLSNDRIPLARVGSQVDFYFTPEEMRAFIQGLVKSQSGLVIVVGGLQASDPGVPGALYHDAGVVKISL